MKATVLEAVLYCCIELIKQRMMIKQAVLIVPWQPLLQAASCEACWTRWVLSHRCRRMVPTSLPETSCCGGDMSEAQREQLTELLDDIYGEFLKTVAEARGKTTEVGLRMKFVDVDGLMMLQGS